MGNEEKTKPTQLQGYSFIGVTLVLSQFLFHGVYIWGNTEETKYVNNCSISP